MAIRHDEDGFLLPQKQQQDIAQTLTNTEEILGIIKQKSKKQPIAVKATVEFRRSRQPEKTKKPIQAQPRPTPMEKRAEQYRVNDAKQTKKQTKLLEEIAHNRNRGAMPLAGMIGGLAKGAANAPRNIFNGARRGRDGRYLPRGRHSILGRVGGLVGGLGRVGRLGKGLVKGGLIAAVLGLLDGVHIERSDLTRGEKNKAHAKNIAVGAGGVAGAALGASIGSIIPVVGTTIGGIVGGMAGAWLSEQFTDYLDSLIDPKISKKMFNSWEDFTDGVSHLWRDLTARAGERFGGFVQGITSAWDGISQAAKNVWESVVPSSFAAYFADLGNMARNLWESLVPQSFTAYFADLGNTTRNMWANVSNMASRFWNGLTQIAANAFKGLQDMAAPVVETVQELAAPAIDWAKEKWEDAKKAVAPAVDWAKEKWEDTKKAVAPAVDWAKQKWDGTKKAAAPVIEKGMEKGKELANYAKNSALSLLGYDMTKKYDHLGYKMGSKSLKNGAIDCSGWTFQVSKMEMESLNQMRGFEKYNVRSSNAGAAEQIGIFAAQNGVVTDTRTGFDKSKLRAGMVIGQMKHGKGYQGRTTNVKGYGKTQYNHVAKVVRGRDGKLYVSESQGGGKNKGVTLTQLDNWVDMRVKRGDTLTAVSPYDAEDLALLNGDLGAVAKNMGDKALNKVNDAVVAAGSKVADMMGGFKGFVAKGESVRKGWSNYDVGNVKRAGGKRIDFYNNRLSQMTLAQVMAEQQAGRLFAAGKYQAIPATLKAAMRDLKLDPNALFDAAMQEKIGTWLITVKRSALGQYISTGQGFDAAALEAAREFSSIPLLQDYKGRKRGRSYYSGDKAQHGVEETKAALEAAHAQYKAARAQGHSHEMAIQAAMTGGAVSPTKTVVATRSPMTPQTAQAVPVATKAAMPPAMPEFVGASVFGTPAKTPAAPAPAVVAARTAPEKTTVHLAHKPISRTVSNSQIAHMASGGIMDSRA